MRHMGGIFLTELSFNSVLQEIEGDSRQRDIKGLPKLLQEEQGKALT